MGGGKLNAEEGFFFSRKSEISSHVITNETKGNPFTFSCVKSDKQTNTQTDKQTNYLGQLCVEI